VAKFRPVNRRDAPFRLRHGWCSEACKAAAKAAVSHFGTARDEDVSESANTSPAIRGGDDAAPPHADIELVVCVPTFRRPEMLRQLLQSLAVQLTTRRFTVAVAENDAVGRQGLPVALSFLKAGALKGVCAIEPEEGNCSAINAAFGTARERFPSAEYFLMIDDDEMASVNWLERMAAAADATGADIVGGPVIQKFPAGTPPALARHPAFKPAYARSGPVPQIYGSGNCLIRRRVFDGLDNPRFDPEFNFTGGGDSDFFTRARRAGFKFHWAQDALVSETVPHHRTQLAWLARRGRCIGAGNYRTDRKFAATPMQRVLLLAKSVAVIPLSFVRAIGFLARGDFRSALHPLNLALGRALATVGVQPRQYGPAQKRSRPLQLQRDAAS
jgi:hypothetical protein